MTGQERKKLGLMQRLSSWFEQLPLRRRGGSSRRSENRGPRPRRQQSKSATPRLRYSVSTVQNYRHRDHSLDVLSHSLITTDQPRVTVPVSWNRQETVTGPCCDNLKFPSMSQSAYAPHGIERKNIRTNPWISRGHSSIHTTIFQSPKHHYETTYVSAADHSASLRVKSLDECTCSSGYGSQDSSPESSVHSPEWQPLIGAEKRCSLEDKAVECNSTDVDEALGIDLENDDLASEDLRTIGGGDQFSKDDEHVYQTLEALNRLSVLLDDRAYSSDSEFASSSSGSVQSPRTLSPVYAQPHQQFEHHQCHCHYHRWKNNKTESTEYPNTASSFTYIPCARYRPAPKFHAPPPPPADDFEKAELDFLMELDAQIAELQVKSIAVRQLVDEARERRDVRARSAQLYLELAELRRMKWVLQNHFELVL